MAKSNLSGLFGDRTLTSREYDEQQLDRMMTTPAQMGAQSAGGRAVSIMGNRGALTGVALNRLLGGKTGEEVRNSRINDALKRVGQGGYATEAEKMAALSQEFENMGMGAESLQAREQARRLEAEDFTMAQAKDKSNIREVKRQVDIIDAYTGKITGQRTATITQQWTGELDERGNKIYADLPGQDGSTRPPAGGDGVLTAQQAAQAALDKQKAAEEGQSNNNTPKTLGEKIDAAEERARMGALTQEADIERAGYNSAAEQVAKRDRVIQQQTDVDRLTPFVISTIDERDARDILRENFEFLNDEQKRELRKRIAAGSYGRPRRPPALSAPPGDITGSRLL